MVLALAMFVPGCHHARTVESARSRHGAQFGCVESDVQVEEIRYDGWQNSGTFAATGCGVRQMYYCDSSRCVADGVPVRLGGTGGGAAPVDQALVTVGAEAPREPAAAATREPASTSIPTPSASDPFAVSVRRRIDERATAIITCNGGPVAIEAQWDNARSATVEFRARGVTDTLIAECIGEALGEVFAPPGTRPGRIIHALAN